jgi:hypothetical protein
LFHKIYFLIANFSLKETGEVKKFSFDYSYWSHDGFDELPNGVLVA